jgi:lipid-binding SYLF domain-containing protein
MRHTTSITTLVAAGLGLGAGLCANTANAGRYHDATEAFRSANQSAAYFKRSYAYAVFPTVGQGGFIVGAAHGSGRVFVHDVYVGRTAVTQLSVGWQAGGQAYSEIIFFENQQALEQFESGNFQFGAGASVTAITAGASAGVSTDGAGAGASAGLHDAAVVGSFNKGMAVFTIAKGGLMVDASLEGEKFSYEARSKR